METPDNIGPAGGDASSGNGGSQNQLNLIELYKMGIRAITDDIRQQLRALPLKAFTEVFALSKLGRLRKKRSLMTAQGEASHLRTVAEHWTGFSTIPLAKLQDCDIGDMCQAMSDAIVPGKNKEYLTGSYNAYVGAVGRQLEFLQRSPFRLITKERLDALRTMIEFGDPDSPADCPLPTPDEERVLIDYVRQRCGHGKRLRSYIAFLLYLFFGVRRGMVTKVDRADVCLEHSKITLTFNKQRGGKCVRITFDMPPLLKAAVEEFLNLPGQPEFKITTIARLLRSAALAAGMANLTPKTFRKLFITRALQKGVDVATIALIVGHNDDGRSILHNYNQYCPEHINAGVKKVNAAYLDLGDPDWVETQRQRARRDTDVIVETRRDVAAAAIEFLDKLQEKIQEQQYDTVLRMVRLPASGLPSEPSEHLPNVPKSRPLSEALQIAANLRALFWKKGLGYNEAAVALGLSKSIIYDIMRGTRQTTDALQKLAGHFGVDVKDLRNPDAPRYNMKLVLANVGLLARLYTVGRLPCSESVTNVIEKRHLPAGNMIRQLAEAVGVSREEFLTQDLSLRSDLQLRPLCRTRKTSVVDPAIEAAKRANFKANLRLRVLRAGMTAREAAEAIGTTRARISNYLAGPSFPPADTLLKIAACFQTSPEALCGPAPGSDAAATDAGSPL